MSHTTATDRSEKQKGKRGNQPSVEDSSIPTRRMEPRNKEKKWEKAQAKDKKNNLKQRTVSGLVFRVDFC